MRRTPRVHPIRLHKRVFDAHGSVRRAGGSLVRTSKNALSSCPACQEVNPSSFLLQSLDRKHSRGHRALQPRSASHAACRRRSTAMMKSCMSVRLHIRHSRVPGTKRRSQSISSLGFLRDQALVVRSCAWKPTPCRVPTLPLDTSASFPGLIYCLVETFACGVEELPFRTSRLVRRSKYPVHGFTPRTTLPHKRQWSA